MSNTNDFENPDDLDQNVDQDMDFGEFEEDKGKSLGAAWKNSPLVKFGLIGAAVLVVVILVALFGGESEKTPSSVVGRGNNLKEAPGSKELSQNMVEAMEEKNQQRIDEAQKQGTSAIPTPIEPPKNLLETPDDVNAEDPLLRWKQMQEERARAQREQQMVEDQKPQGDPQRDAAVQNMSTAMLNQINSILGREKDKQMKHITVFDANALKDDKNSTTVDGTTATSAAYAASQVPAKPANVIVAAGKVEYAQMMLEANSDIPGPVVSMIVSGPFNGGKLMGSFTRQEDYLVIKYNTLVTKKGTSVKINAIAVDPQTSLTGVATDVDHRYFQRIVLPAAAKFVEGLGSAYSQTTQTTSQSSSSTTTTSEDMNTKQEFGKAVEEAASKVSEVLDEDGKNTQPLVIVGAGTPLGVLFMASVTDQDILMARAGIEGGQQGVPQQQQPAQPQPMMFNSNAMNAYQQLQMGLQNQQFMQQGGMQNSNSNQQPTGSYGTVQ